MARCSNVFLGVFNFLIFILSLPIIGYGVWLAIKNTTECDKVSAIPMMIFGASLNVMSLIGMFGAWGRNSAMLILYLVLMTLAILAFGGFSGFVLAVTHKTATDNDDQSLKLQDRSHWLNNKVNENKNWNKIRSCLTDMKVCSSSSFSHKIANDSMSKLYSHRLTSIQVPTFITHFINTWNHFLSRNSNGLNLLMQSGCCKPADDCRFTYKGAYTWNKAKGNAVNPDCAKWENGVDKLCFNCESCKAGVVKQVEGYWKTIAVFIASVLSLLISLYVFGICACCNNIRRGKASDTYNPYYYPYKSNAYA